MARKPSSVPGLKYLFPSYYLRRPRRLVFLLLLFGGVFFFILERQNQAREMEALASKIQQLEGEKGTLSAQLETLSSQKAALEDKVEAQAQAGQGQKGQEGLAQGQGQAQGAGSQGQGQAQGLEGAGDTSRGIHADPLILGVGVGGGSRKLLPKKTLEEPKVGLQAQLSGTLQQQAVLQAHVGEGGLGLQVARAEVGANAEEAARKEALLRQTEERREAIRNGMIHAWTGYEKYAWGEDELQPMSKDGVSNFGGMGATIVDSLDTLFIMGLTEQFGKARDWVSKFLNFDKDYTCSVFETTIRVLGGLLSAYDLSGDTVFLLKARQLADRLLPAWNTPSGIPWHYLNLRDGRGESPGWAGGSSVLADVGTTQVEMIALTQRTNDSKYASASEKVIQVIDKHFPSSGLVPIYINPSSGDFTSSHITFGAMGDSFYEYLLKVWVLGGKTHIVKRYREMWEQSVRGMMQKLVRKTSNGDFTYVAEENGGGIINKMDHLLCFTGGMLTLGAVDAQEEQASEYLSLAKELTKTCVEFYRSQPSKLSGENYRFYSGMSVGEAYNIGRPETVESLFYLWRATKDQKYRDWGWEIWQAFERNCRVEAGYTGLRNVAMDPPPRDNMMQSFFLAETVKYLYLLFSPDDVIPLDKWVFNTEAHPIKIVPRTQPF